MSLESIFGNEPLQYAPPVKRRWSGRNVLLWLVGVVVIGGMLISVLLPSLCKAREPANKSKCASNLHQIGLAIVLYTNDNAGHYPPSLAVLLKEEKLTPVVLVCPSSNDEPSTAADSAGIVAELAGAEADAAGHKHCLSYVYVGGNLTTATVTDKTVVAYEPLSNHDDDGTNVLFGDGHAEWVKGRDWPKVAAAAGVAVVKSSTTRP